MRDSADSGKQRQPPRENFYTLREAARILRVSERTMRELLQSSEVHGVKLRGQWRIPYAEMQRLGEPKPGTQKPAEEAPPDMIYGECL